MSGRVEGELREQRQDAVHVDVLQALLRNERTGYHVAHLDAVDAEDTLRDWFHNTSDVTVYVSKDLSHQPLLFGGDLMAEQRDQDLTFDKLTSGDRPSILAL